MVSTGKRFIFKWKIITTSSDSSGELEEWANFYQQRGSNVENEHISLSFSFHIHVHLYHIYNDIGFTPALLNIGSGIQQLSKSARDGNRCLVKAPELSSYLFRILEDHLPSNICAVNGQGI